MRLPYPSNGDDASLLFLASSPEEALRMEAETFGGLSGNITLYNGDEMIRRGTPLPVGPLFG